MVTAYSKLNEKQDRTIMDFFRRNPLKFFTPFEIQEACLPFAPIGSVRRTMTNLAQSGELIKTDIKKPGKFGRNNYTWSYREKIGQTYLFGSIQ